MTIVTQYDVELLLAIEEHQGAKLQTLELDEPPVLALLPEVASARRAALMELQESGFIEREKARRSQKRQQRADEEGAGDDAAAGAAEAAAAAAEARRRPTRRRRRRAQAAEAAAETEGRGARGRRGQGGREAEGQAPAERIAQCSYEFLQQKLRGATRLCSSRAAAVPRTRSEAAAVMRQRHVRSTQSSLFKTKPFSLMSE